MCFYCAEGLFLKLEIWLYPQERICLFIISHCHNFCSFICCHLLCRVTFLESAGIPWSWVCILLLPDLLCLVCDHHQAWGCKTNSFLHSALNSLGHMYMQHFKILFLASCCNPLISLMKRLVTTSTPPSSTNCNIVISTVCHSALIFNQHFDEESRFG